MALCWSCSKVKGKRSCPARGGDSICSRCCGTKRRVEIRCPADCSYLHGSHDRKWTSENREKEAARFFSGALSLDERPAQFYLFLHHTIVTRGKPLVTLEDEELRDVLETTIKTLETRARGILYTHPSTSPHLQSLSDWLTGLVTMRERVKGAPSVSEDEALVALRALRSSIGSEASRETTRERYLERVERILSQYLEETPVVELPEELTDPRPGLIVPP
jgi:hypothetical protein